MSGPLRICTVLSVLAVLSSPTTLAQTPNGRPRDHVLYGKRISDPDLERLRQEADSVRAAADSISAAEEKECLRAKRQETRQKPVLKFDWTGIVKPDSPEAFHPPFHFPPLRQYRTGTCWAFSTTSFIESDVARRTDRKVKLSELHTVYWEYVEKARGYVAKHGCQPISAGSECDAVAIVLQKYGAVPASVYPGFLRSSENLDDVAMTDEISRYLQFVKERGFWDEDAVVAQVRAILDRTMGSPPEQFVYEGKHYTPKSFVKDVLEFDPADYVQIMSTLSLPFYTKGKFDFADNWRPTTDYYNVPLQDFYGSLVGALSRGFTVAIGGDISEPGIDGQQSAAVVPTFDVPQEYIDQDSREFRIDNRTTADDHGIHLLATMKVGDRDWFLVKDSASRAYWGKYPGYLFLRDDFVKLKMLSYMVHKDAVQSLLPKFEAATLPAGLDPLVQNVDRGIKPGDDFFQYANGTWLKKHPIPASERSWSIGREVREEVFGQLRKICEESAAPTSAPVGSDQRNVGSFWLAGMDSSSIEAAGISPLQPELDRIDAVGSRSDLLETAAFLQTAGASPLYTIYVGQDDKNSAAYAVFLHQGGIGLPDRDYYFLDDPETAKIRESYPEHVAAMFRLLGSGEEAARKSADSVMKIETALAGGSRTLEERRDPYANYNKVSIEGLARLAPSIDWRKQLEVMGIPPVDSVVVGQPEFFTRLDSTLAAEPLDAWKDYLRWSLVHAYAPYLSSAFDKENFRFYGTLMSGVQEQRPRWKRVLDAEENVIGDLMGKVWVARYCSPTTKARYEKLVDAIFDAYADRISRLDWMSAATKQKALAKLARVDKKVGYPDVWRDFSGLSLQTDSYARNEMRANEWWFHYFINKLGKPVDRTEWFMTPQTWNAYYDGSKVEIVLPAAVFMIPGVPDSLLDDAILYSYAGAATIGHEITHGFDDEGRQYDADGNMNPWWTAADSSQFAGRTKVLVDQFDAFTVGERHVRGLATLGENIADLGGLVIAHDAFKKTDEWKKGERVNGLTPDQRFFLGYAFSWLGHMRPESLAQQIMTDVHAPDFLRVNGPVSNMPEFYAAFGVKPGNPMYRVEDKRVAIW